MKHGETVNKAKNNHNILLYAILFLGVLAFVFDHFFPVNVESIAEVAEFSQSIIAIIAGIWITGYLLFMELYKDRFLLEPLVSDRLPHMRNNFILIVYDIIYGGILVYFDYGLFGSICFLVASLSTILIIFIDVYKAYQTLMVSTYVTQYFSKVSAAFNSHTKTIHPKFLREIKLILNESLGKEEYYTAQTIVEQTGKTFRDYLGNLIKLSDELGVEKVEDSFNDVVKFNIKELDLCKNCQSEVLIRVLLHEQECNLAYCIEKKQYEWYKLYFKEFSSFVFQMQKEENISFTYKLYGIYYRLLIKLIEQSKNEWIEYSINKIESLTFAYIYIFNKNNIQNYVMLLVQLLEMCVEKQNNDSYKIFFEKLREFTEGKYIERGGFNEVKAFYFSLFSTLVKESPMQALEFVEIVLDKSIRSQEDASLLEFKLLVVKELSNAIGDTAEYQSKLFNYNIGALFEAIGLNKDYNGYLSIPNFYKRIESQGCPQEIVNETIDSIKNLLHHCIVKDYLPPFYTLLRELGEALSKTSQQQKEIQKKLLSIYFWLFDKTIILVNQQFFELTFELFRQNLDVMDKNKAISSDLGKYIITRVAKTHSGIRRDSEKLTIRSIELLFSLMSEGEEYHFVISNVEQRKFLYRTLFNIGTECIENNFEEGLRRVSNSLGWLIIYNLKLTSQAHITYLIQRACELFYLAKKMGISEKTQMFMLTLFTTVGSYCCKDASYMRYRDAIIESIKDESIERIKIAVSLRTSENDMWNELYDNRTEQLTKEFLKAFTRKTT